MSYAQKASKFFDEADAHWMKSLEYRELGDRLSYHYHRDEYRRCRALSEKYFALARPNYGETA